MKKDKRAKTSSIFLYAFIFAMIARGAALFLSLDSFNSDPDAYRALAENMYSYGVFGEKEIPTAFRPPLYPATLAALIPLRAPEERPTQLNRVYNDDARARARATNSVADFFNRKLALSRNASIALWHWILGLATVVLTYAFAVRLGLSRTLAALAATLVAVDPILLQQSRLVMTETLAAFFAAALLFATFVVAQRRALNKASCAEYLLLGALYGLSTLCRPTFFVFLALAALNLALLETLRPDRSSRAQDPQPTDSQLASAPHKFRGGARILCFLLGCACLIAPWCARNYREFGKPIVTTTHGGYTLLLANNPEIYRHYATAASPWSLWEPADFFARNQRDFEEAVAKSNLISPKEKEIFQNEWTRRDALDTIKERPSIFAYSCFIRIGELWRPLPNDVDRNLSSQAGNSGRQPLGRKVTPAALKDQARFAVAGFYLIEFLLVIIGCVKLYRAKRGDRVQRPIAASPFVWGFLLIISVQLPHLFYWTNMRMRAPLEVFLPVLAAVAFTPRRALAREDKANNQNPQND